MSKTKLGDACAYIPGKNGGKNRYCKIGVVFKDNEKDYLSIKIDTLPLPGTGWEGWINIFDERKPAESGVEDTGVIAPCPVCNGVRHRDKKGLVCNYGHREKEDDIPF